MSRSVPTPPRRSRARRAGTLSSPSAPRDTAGSPSPQTPDSQTAPSHASPSPSSTPAAPTTPAPEPATGAKDNQHATDAQTPSAVDTLYTPAAVQQCQVSIHDTREAEILDALHRGMTYTEIAQTYRASKTTIARIAHQMDAFDQGTVAKLMSIKALGALDAWETAMKTGAAMGKHAAAKDWLTHARVLDPVQSDASSGAKVTIIIGSDVSPLTPDLPQVIDITPVTSDKE